MANTVKTTFEVDTKPQDRALARVERDIRRYELERAKGEKALTDLITKQAEQQYRAKVAAQKRATQDILAELKKEENARKQAARSDASSINTLTGGLLAGGVAGGVILGGAAVLTAVRELTSAVTDLGSASLRVAANFEQTRNALQVFTGSASGARAELKQISDIARRTPGLGLEDAEQGAARLRALGFQAETVQKLLVGLGKQRILSGVGSDAINRVTLNLGQLATGSGDFQDVRDLVTNLPTVRKELVATFGSLQQFQQALKDNPTEAIERLASALADVKSPAGGANDAFQKLTDEFIRAGRALGEPVLAPLTEDVRDLNKALEDNSGKLVKFGEDVADIYRSVSFWLRTTADLISNMPALPEWVQKIINAGLDRNAGSLGVQAVGTLARQGNQLEAIQNQGASANAGLFGDLSGVNKLVTTQLKEAEDAVKQSYEIRQSITENYYKVLEARVAVSGKSETEQIKTLSQIRRGAIQQQLADLSDYYNKAIKTVADKTALDKLSAQYVVQKGKLETELALNSINTEQRLAEVRKKQAEERKREAEKAQREAEQLQKAVRGLFDSVASGNSNPYIKFLADSEKFSRSLLEVTKGLTAEQRSFLQAQNDANIARERSQQRASSIVEAFGLQTEARDFRRGYRATGQQAIQEQNFDLQRLFGELRNGRITQSAYDQQVVDLTRGLDPRNLTYANRLEAANARDRRATEIGKMEEKASSFYEKMLRNLGDKGLKVTVAEASMLDITIKDQSASGTTAATSGSVNARYGK